MDDLTIEKIFIEGNKTYAAIIPFLIILAFSGKGISLYFARSIVIVFGNRIIQEIQNEMADHVLLSDTQNLETKQNYFLTLNPICDIKKSMIVKKINFTHPYLNIKSFEMQKRLNTLQGKKRIWFSGSYFGYGFHEDGLNSSLEMLKQFEVKDGDMHLQGHNYASKI